MSCAFFRGVRNWAFRGLALSSEILTGAPTQLLLPWLNSSPSFVLFRLKSYRAPMYAAQPVLLSFPWRPGVSGSSLNNRPPPNAFVFVFGWVMLKPPDPNRLSLPGPMSLRTLSRVSWYQSMSPRSVEGRRLENGGGNVVLAITGESKMLKPRFHCMLTCSGSVSYGTT